MKLPIRSWAVMNFRWVVRVPAKLKSGLGDDSAANINFRKISFLVMNKIGIEHLDGDGSKSKRMTHNSTKLGSELGTSDTAEAYFKVKRQLEVLQVENGQWKKAVEDLRQEIVAGKFSLPSQDFNCGRYSERNGMKHANGSGNERRVNDKKSEGDVNEELKKALKRTAGVRH